MIETRPIEQRGIVSGTHRRRSRLSSRKSARESSRCGAARPAPARCGPRRRAPPKRRAVGTRMRGDERRQAHRPRRAARSRQRSSIAKRSRSRFGPSAKRASAARTGTGSTSRISRPMYCIWRRRASCRVIVRASADRVAKRAREVRASQVGRAQARRARRPDPAIHASRSCAGSSTAASRRLGVGRWRDRRRAGHRMRRRRGRSSRRPLCYA